MNGFDSYYQYEMLLAHKVLLPFFEKMDISLDGKRILDVGCGEGGFLKALAERFQLQGLGIDYDQQMIDKCVPATGISYQQADFLCSEFEHPFDLVILRDVLEHCGDFSRMLEKAASVLTDNGLGYITYTPFSSPFGGHQHQGTGMFAHVPYIQLLPESVFLQLIKPASNTYKTSESLWEDLTKIRKTRMASGKIKSICRQSGFDIPFHRTYFIRPDYYYRYGLPAIAWPSFLPITAALDPFCTSVEMIVRKQ